LLRDSGQAQGNSFEAWWQCGQCPCAVLMAADPGRTAALTQPRESGIPAGGRPRMEVIFFVRSLPVPERSPTRRGCPSSGTTPNAFRCWVKAAAHREAVVGLRHSRPGDRPARERLGRSRAPLWRMMSRYIGIGRRDWSPMPRWVMAAFAGGILDSRSRSQPRAKPGPVAHLRPFVDGQRDKMRILTRSRQEFQIEVAGPLPFLSGNGRCGSLDLLLPGSRGWMGTRARR